MFEIVTGDRRPIFRQIIDGIGLKIASGELPPGHRLPSVRGLALELMVNPNTVAKAYTQLTAQGMIESRPGVGVFVCEQVQRLNTGERERRLNAAVDRLVADVIPLGFSTGEVTRRVQDALEPLTLGPQQGEEHQ